MDKMMLPPEKVNTTKSSSFFKSTIQKKLSVGSANDTYEAEADAMANKVMRMQEPKQQNVSHSGSLVQRKCAHCEQEEKIQKKSLAENITPLVQRSSTESVGESQAPSHVENQINSSRGGGNSMDHDTKNFMESRFGTDFSAVRIHTGSQAVQMSRELNAQAFTVGNDVYFNEGKYSPNTDSGKHLLAHELTHTVQQGNGIHKKPDIQLYGGCTTTQNTTIDADHILARSMLSRAISEVGSYNGTVPSKVFNALNTHFHGATSNSFATWLNLNLRTLWGLTWMAGYQCETVGGSSWACTGSDYATTFWCVPLVDIRLCPSYFPRTSNERASTLIHEWVHKYGCNFDLGYEWETTYPSNGTITQLLNADSFAKFIRDVQ
jgi:hypothetical protein